MGVVLGLTLFLWCVLTVLDQGLLVFFLLSLWAGEYLYQFISFLYVDGPRIAWRGLWNVFKLGMRFPSVRRLANSIIVNPPEGRHVEPSVCSVQYVNLKNLEIYSLFECRGTHLVQASRHQ